MSNMDLLKKQALEQRLKASGVVVQPEFEGISYKIHDVNLVLGEKIARGQCSELYRPAGLNERYGRKNLCLKVFILSTTEWGHPRGVGVSNIVESSMVQNLLAFRGLAPRVYDIIRVGGRTAQVLEFVEGAPGVVPVVDDRFTIDPVEVKNPDNFVAGKLVDLQGTVFKDFKAYKKALLERAARGVVARGAGASAYESTPYFQATRDTAERLKKYNFQGFEGKTVLDIGCNYGMFSREAHKLGAKRVVGLDWPAIVAISRELAILDGYFNLDFIGVDLRSITPAFLKGQTGIDRFDIHLFLAMEMWIGWPDWVKNCSTMYYEGHGVDRPFEVRHF